MEGERKKEIKLKYLNKTQRKKSNENVCGMRLSSTLTFIQTVFFSSSYLFIPLAFGKFHSILQRPNMYAICMMFTLHLNKEKQKQRIQMPKSLISSIQLILWPDLNDKIIVDVCGFDGIDLISIIYDTHHKI